MSASAMVLSTRLIVALTATVSVVLYGVLAVTWYHQVKYDESGFINEPEGLLQRPRSPAAASYRNDMNETVHDMNPEPLMTYPEWRSLAVDLAGLNSSEALRILNENDPFGVRHFEASLLAEETRLGRSLRLDEVKRLFPCPVQTQRIMFPDMRDNQKAESFRGGNLETFLLFQHLRKAGGTHFCFLAQANLPESQVPPYYCMPDKGWEGSKCAGCLHGWSNDFIVQQMNQDGHRVAGNEWDRFDVTQWFELPAVFATSFRRPLDRALSQFRFACLENRGCKYKDIVRWWKVRTHLHNIYVCTFANEPCLKERYKGGNFESVHEKQKRREMMATALDTIAKFHLVLVMEWLAYAGPQVRSVLGFQDTSVLTKRVRPHTDEAERDDGQEENKLGAAGIAKASWTSKEYLKPRQYEAMSHGLALDEILTDAARRMFLERLVCST